MTTANAYVEHANICVENPASTIQFLLAAIPDWSVRGKGSMDWFGVPIEWFHVGDERSYIAIQSGGADKSQDWQALWTGVKHVGIVVQDMDAVVKNLEAAGFEIDHYGGSHPFRKNVYFLERHGIQFEFIEYLSDAYAKRNQYA